MSRQPPENQPPENWPPGGGMRGCGSAAAFCGGVVLTVPLMAVAVNAADPSAPWPGIVISLLLVGAAVAAFRGTSRPLRACALGLLIAWAAATIVTAGGCTGFAEFALY